MEKMGRAEKIEEVIWAQWWGDLNKDHKCGLCKPWRVLADSCGLPPDTKGENAVQSLLTSTFRNMLDFPDETSYSVSSGLLLIQVSGNYATLALVTHNGWLGVTK